jgi:hypothetical protein
MRQEAKRKSQRFGTKFFHRCEVASEFLAKLKSAAGQPRLKRRTSVS